MNTLGTMRAALAAVRLAGTTPQELLAFAAAIDAQSERSDGMTVEEAVEVQCSIVAESLILDDTLGMDMLSRARAFGRLLDLEETARG